MPSPRNALAIVLAAGEGTRMKSDTPKVLHQVAGRSMLAHVLAAVAEAEVGTVAIVMGPGRDDVRVEALRLTPGARTFVQSERLGTAHAVLAAREAIAAGYDDLLVLFADTPLVSGGTIRALREALAQGAGVAALGFIAADPFGYGRLLQDASGRLVAIREEKDASETERAVKLCNAGLMALDGKSALDWLGRIGNANAKGEYYLTDVVEMARAAGREARVVLADESEVLGVNDRIQLAQAEAVAQSRLRRAAMAAGVTMIAPETVFLCADTVFGRDVLLEPNVVIGPGVTIGDKTVIHAFSHLEGAKVGADAAIGPFARLRPGAALAEAAKVGNFVEIKNANVAKGAKVNHLTYIGDADIGANANIGAGTITCNYDGFFKYRTVIGENAFIGSNSALVAPVTVGAGAYVGSGSVVTKDVTADALAVARGRQMEKAGWAANFRSVQTDKKAKK
ncbi:bifunctional UDP-N-acetylglucosamine diphosphorylase/glucosamine-1-phosphate N-acetyltransferase GlmU [Methylocystis parvus]|uniref:Bifunctional protein GlmU n=1 Tax=Methylocystis parvus TaxID=134 RepID=A0A6B8M8S2_9HYPH|nr:bifunctional UDP-N-acetylglucosamine diphosphorylase/glucosamine-1-phosphate N-acetyltransferase GlmU [Methylocystis parvus]QGM98282.1 bifunctional UDP-N-acetylglucosamine diphosphorylase/glucosamine-1-phosphate N-acetyltransferase GlmU [Methylocystis parvus]WBK01393.1 bifunctional UDP-N-acetylglucosamine diphosphorylase/glucosamine-1-phosphate N-acetyltransferase GlmU [Methylocystis parvus OBBP]